MIFEPLIDHLESNVSILTLRRGTNLFINQMPIDTPMALMLKNSYAGIEIDPYIPGMRSGKIVLVGRGTNYQKLSELMHHAIEVLRINDSRLSDTIHAHSIRPMTEPLVYPTSIANQVEMSVNVSVKYAIIQQ